MLILPKSKWIFFLWIEQLVHFSVNHCDSVVDHWSKGWPYTPYILMRQSSGQNMHGQWLRTLSRLCIGAVSALQESSQFIDFTILHCQRRVTISVSAYYTIVIIKESVLWPEFGNSSPCVLEVLRKRAGVRGGGRIVAYEYKSRFN